MQYNEKVEAMRQLQAERRALQAQHPAQCAALDAAQGRVVTPEERASAAAECAAAAHRDEERHLCERRPDEDCAAELRWQAEEAEEAAERQQGEVEGRRKEEAEKGRARGHVQVRARATGTSHLAHRV